MLDFHSHILPRVDDGSQGLEESLLMLSAMKDQGVTTVIATPHFYANDDSVDSFLSRRDAAYAALAPQYTDVPRIILGAEVKYYEGISRLPDLKRLRIDGSRLLLLEMSMSKWSEYAVREVLEETGISVEISEKFISEYVYNTHGGVKKRAVYFVAEYTGQIPKLSEREIAGSWSFTYEEAIRKLNYPQDMIVLMEVHDYYEQKRKSTQNMQ